MYPFDVKTTEKKNYLPAPNLLLDKLEKWMRRNNVEYEIFDQDSVPDNVPNTYTVHGRKRWTSLHYIYTIIDPEDFAKVIEDMSHLSDDDI